MVTPPTVAGKRGLVRLDASATPEVLATASESHQDNGMATLSLAWTDHPPPAFTGGAVTVGNFDGVHRGHQALVTTARRGADRVDGPCVVVTFDPPPAALLYPRPEKAIPLTTYADRADLLHAAGADHVVTLKTDAGLLSLSPEAFFEDVLLGLFRAKAVIEGYNFRFGRGRGGDNATLRELCLKNALAFEEVSPLAVAGEVVSSSRVRTALLAGDVNTSTELLGRAYRIAGTVVTGAKRGRTIGFPTANLGDVPTLLPKEGVYAVRALTNGTSYAAAANIGPNPTFGDDARKIEVHLLDFGGDLYGTPLGVEFVARLRDTKPFAGVGELVEQLQSDIVAAKAILDPLRMRVEHILRTIAAPALDLDGSQIEVVEVVNGIASVRLGAVCASCPGSLSAVVAALEQELRRHVPEVEILEPIA